MQEFYADAAYAVVPGFMAAGYNFDYFERYKLSNNYFSTKAAEALSAGVPLLVNVELTDLVRYARDKHCGIAFEIRNGKPIFEVDPSDPKVLATIRAGAQSAAVDFHREQIWEAVESYWRQGSLL